MAKEVSLNRALLQPLDTELEQLIVEKLLGQSTSTHLCFETSRWQPYFQYYTNQCAQWQPVRTRSHQDIVELGLEIKQHDRQKIEQAAKVKTDRPPGSTHATDHVDASLNLTARLMLMLDIGKLPGAFSGRKHLLWQQGYLKDFVHQYFSGAPALECSGIKLGDNFTANTLEAIASLEIIWTDNLADHLRLTSDDQKVHIYHHATFLMSQRDNEIYPPGFVHETIMTLKLLFPKLDKNTVAWFKQQQKENANSMMLDPCVRTLGQPNSDQRQIEHYHFWRDRLVMLKQLFDESPPRTLKQWWIDRRNVVQWSTFWVAISVLVLTVFFGLVQSIEGALQVYKAYRPTKD